MPLLDRLKERVETDMSDAELQALLDAALAEIEARYGPNAQITVHLGDERELRAHRRFLDLTRPADTALAITIAEIEPGDTGDAANETTLAADDYRVLHRGRTLERLVDGANGRMFWAPLVRVAYTPVSDQKQRDEVAIKLAQLDLTYRGLDKQEGAGDWSRSGSVTPDAFTRERDVLLATLAPRRGLLMA